MQRVLRYCTPLAWFLAGLLVLSLGPGCSVVCTLAPKLCKPTPAPTPTPTPTPTPEPTPVLCPVTDKQAAQLCQDSCSYEKYSGCRVECAADGTAPVVICVEPTPEPTPTPTPEPTPEPGATCPKPLAPGASVYIVINTNFPPGRFGATPRVKGDPEFCRLIHGVAVNDCHLEGWPKRESCERLLMGGCPVWEYLQPGTTTPQQCHDDHIAWAGCDHFGSPGAMDDPQTKDVFEGLPAACGIQRDEFGPNAGFFTIAHGIGKIRPCIPNNPGVCGSWKPFDH